MDHDLPLAVQWGVAALLVVGGVFALVGAIGLLRFPDFFMRLHAPTKATTLGVGGVLLASLALGLARGAWGVEELLITLFLFLTAPVSANLMAQAAWNGFARIILPHVGAGPDEMLVCGMSLGYADESALVNGFQTPREPVASFTRWLE